MLPVNLDIEENSTYYLWSEKVVKFKLSVDEKTNKFARITILTFGEHFIGRALFKCAYFFLKRNWLPLVAVGIDNKTRTVLVNINSLSRSLLIEKIRIEEAFKNNDLNDFMRNQLSALSDYPIMQEERPETLEFYTFKKNITLFSPHFNTIKQLTNPVCEISELEAQKIIFFIQKNKENWQQELQAQSDKNSLYMRHNTTPLKYTLEYFRNGEIWIHTKLGFGQDKEKKVKISINAETGQAYERWILRPSLFNIKIKDLKKKIPSEIKNSQQKSDYISKKGALKTAFIIKQQWLTKEEEIRFFNQSCT